MLYSKNNKSKTDIEEKALEEVDPIRAQVLKERDEDLLRQLE